MKIFYFRALWEGISEDGFYYAEIIGNVIKRQIIEIDGKLYWSTIDSEKDERYFFTDQPEICDDDLIEMENDASIVNLDESEFNELWNRSKF